MKKNLFLTLSTNAVFILFASAALAATGLPWEGPIATLQQSLTGPIAFGIALIAIMVTGGMLIFGGEINEFAKRGSYVALVLGLLVTANNALAVLFPAVAGAGAVI